MVEAYCVKCREKREMSDMRVEKNEKGRYAAKGKCPKCGTNMTRFLSQEDGERMMKKAA